MDIPPKRGRGRPPGSGNKKKGGQANTQSSLSGGLASSLPNISDIPIEEEDSDVESVAGSVIANLDSSIERIFKELKAIRQEFRNTLKQHEEQIKQLREENTALKERCGALESKMNNLEASQEKHASLLNKQERFSRRNNIRIVGVKTESGENCIEISRNVMTKVCVPNCSIERAHRDGKQHRNRDRHLLVKLSFYQDKVTALRNRRHALQNETYHITDDLTLVDLNEKRKWSNQVTGLFQRGTKLRFSGGCWRTAQGKPYNFTRPNAPDQP
ncbi:hypothetical protein HOLleu_37872 [Holothuria leucospilota]|uniref:Uncharacterized protein n=1 Tax=Holothuria leucospilota TaxID=206669 RepID=A0A9Q0YPL1_HOLLE|nr:hypothetical protein HOLleu_37872 [Holothuria leucospilota]